MSNFRIWFNQKLAEEKEQFLGEYPRLLLEGEKPEDLKQLCKLLSDYDFIHTKINHPLFGVQALIEDYDLHPHPILTKIQGALRLSAHLINQDSQQLAAQLSGRLRHFHEPEINNLLQTIATDPGLHCLTPSLTPPGSALIRTLTGHSDSVNAIALTPDGKTVISGSRDKTIKIWDVETGAEKFTLTGHSYSVNAIALTPDGKTVISGSYDKTIKIWDVVTGAEKFTLTGHSNSVNAIAVTPDGKTVISGSRDKTIKIWDVVTGAEKFTLTGHSYSVNAIAVTLDGKT
ncbi:hypothetical protein PN459_18455, partial [Microcystis aeruginosa CS-567/02-A1]|nr:hypothetical protein [Microcystis aeruginosa CS-567/02-A1]